MNEPRRMREEGGSALEQALLEAGRSAGVSPRTRARTLAALGLAAGPLVIAAAPTQAAGVIAAASEVAPATATGSATATSALATKFALTTTLSKVVASVTLAGAIAAVPLGTMAWRRLHAPATVESNAITAVATTTAQPDQREVSGRGDRAPATTSANSLTDELAALDTARLRVARGDVTGALSALDDYGRRFPRGRLAMEAEVLRIDALAHGGRTAAARSRADAFLRNHPGSVLTSRVRQYLGD